MICEKLEGVLGELETTGKQIEYVEIEWHEAFKKIHKKTTDCGRDVGIRMGDWVLTRGLQEGDVIYQDENRVIAVHTPPCEIIQIRILPEHEEMTAKICYEIGNRHAPLFWGEKKDTFVTPYNEPMFQMLRKFHGVSAERAMGQLNFHKKISASVHKHHH